MAYLNQIQLIGNVGYDPDIKTLEFGRLATFKVATTEKFKDRNGQPKENTQWHQVTASGPLVDVVEKFIRRGSLVFVSGKMVYRTWKDKEGNDHTQAEVQLHTLQMLNRPKTAAPAQAVDNDDDLPDFLQD